MLRLKQRFAGPYTLRARVYGEGDTPVTVSDPHVEIRDGDDVLADGTPVPEAGQLVFEVAHDTLAVGVYLARFTGKVGGEEQEWRVWFEVVASEAYPPTELLAEVKTALRVTADAYDAEIEGLIAAAKLDLKLSGVSAEAVDAPSPAPLVRLAIVVYCKATFGLDNPDSEKYLASFHSLETALALSSEFGA